MPKLLLSILFLFTLSFLFAQSPAEKLVLKVSKEKFMFMNGKDTDKLKSLLDDRLIFVHSNGMAESKDELILHLKENKWEIKKVDIEKASCRIFKNNMAVVNGKGLFSVTSEGKDIELTLLYTEVWVHYKKGWLLASRHANRM